MRVRLLRDHAIDGKWELAGAVLNVANDLGRALLHEGYAEAELVPQERAVQRPKARRMR